MSWIIEKRQGNMAVVNGKEVVIFSSNDYLGLSAHPDILKLAIDTAENYGIGTGGAPGTTGTTDIHIKLAETVAKFKSREKAVIFPSGYQANIALHQALGCKDVIFYLDYRSHPSAIDGTRQAKDTLVQRFDHKDLVKLETDIKSNPDRTNIVSLPSVFTVDGNIAPLDKLIKLKNNLDFVLILDEAHATGCIGANGMGLEEHFKLKGTADFIMGTFSKALGSQGGFVTYNNSAVGFLKSGFRAFDYSTSLSTISAAAALKAFELLLNDKSIYAALKNNKQAIIESCNKKGINIIAHESMIMLIPCDNIKELIGKLVADGYFTVPVKALVNGQSIDCLRIIPMALHTNEQIDGFTDSLRKHL
jgi:7-keto-8-aminopelargonate synthetase-like enzyme